MIKLLNCAARVWLLYPAACSAFARVNSPSHSQLYIPYFYIGTIVILCMERCFQLRFIARVQLYNNWLDKPYRVYHGFQTCSQLDGIYFCVRKMYLYGWNCNLLLWFINDESSYPDSLNAIAINSSQLAVKQNIALCYTFKQYIPCNWETIN